MPSFPRRRESRDFKPYQSLNIPKNQGLDSRLRGNDGMGIAIYFNLLWEAGFRRPFAVFTWIPFPPIPPPLFEPCPA